MERLTEEQKALAEKALCRAESIAERYARIFPEHEAEFLSAASFGAVRAAATYNPELGGVWQRWSELCIRGSIRNFLGDPYLEHKKRFVSDKAIDGVAWHDGDLTAIARSEAGQDFDRLLGMLPAKHRELCEKVYKEGMTAGQAGKALGYSPNHGDKLHREAIGILRDQLAA